MHSERRIRLGLSIAGHGYHDSAWLHPQARPHGPSELGYYVEIARLAERGLFDMVFLADLSFFPMADGPAGALGRRGESGLEPLTLLAALASQTRNVGLVATASTSFYQPFHLARTFASLDQISGGRAGWNVVTSSMDEEARNFSMPAMAPKQERYERAEEFVDVVTGLWDSFDHDTFEADRSTGRFFDPAKVRPLNHIGRYFQVDGPLNVRRSPQDRPVIVQAGASAEGQDLAARTADVVYALQTTLGAAERFYGGLKARMKHFGREPDDLKIMPGLMPIVGATEAEAQAKLLAMKDMVDPHVGLEYLSIYFGDLSRYPLDGPLPELRQDRQIQSRGQAILDIARRNGYSIRQLFQSICVSNAHHLVVGTPSTIADVMEKWFVSGAADGFNILPTVSPVSIADFVDQVVPELQRRGLLRTRYEATTLRGNLGLKSPPMIQRASIGPRQSDIFPALELS